MAELGYAGSINTYVDLIEQYRRAYEHTKNPLFVWKSIYFLTPFLRLSSRNSNEKIPQELTSIPTWCLEYIMECSLKISELQFGMRTIPATDKDSETYKPIDERQAIEALPSALAFARSGWNAFAEDKSLEKTASMLMNYIELRDEGLSGRQAMDVLFDRYCLENERSVRKRFSRYRKVYPTVSTPKDHEQT